MSEQFQKNNVNNNFSLWCKTLPGVLQRSTLDPPLFSILIHDTFLFIKKAYFCNFADDNSLYSIQDKFKEVKFVLKKN